MLRILFGLFCGRSRIGTPVFATVFTKFYVLFCTASLLTLCAWFLLLHFITLMRYCLFLNRLFVVLPGLFKSLVAKSKLGHVCMFDVVYATRPVGDGEVP